MPFAWLWLAAAAAFTSEFSIGADWTDQRYSVVEEDTTRGLIDRDTLEIATEGRIGWRPRLSLPGLLELDGRLDLSTAAIRGRLDLELERRLGSILRLTAASVTDARHHHRLLPALGDTAWAADRLENYSALRLGLNPDGNIRLDGRAALDLLGYPPADTTRTGHAEARAGLEAGWHSNDDAELIAGWDWTRRFAGTTRYRQHAGRLDIDVYPEAGPRIAASAELARRDYSAGGESYWELNPTLELHQPLGDRLSLIADAGLLVDWYRPASAIWTDAAEAVFELGFEHRPSAAFTWRAGGEQSLRRSLPQAADDDFRQPAFTAGLDWFAGDRYWLSLDSRLGTRRHRDPDSAFLSDYAFADFTLLAGATLWERGPARLRLDAFATITPEWHADPADNYAGRIITVELTWRN